ncbi:MAG TPA: CHAT domain-containing protein [Coleofasciculaceae cyanobacterium]|jgi:CHAT domain-containing protein
MRLPLLSIKIFLVLTWMLLATESVRAQSGNMSDVTLPSPDSMISEPPAEGTTDDDNTLTEEVPVEESGVSSEDTTLEIDPDANIGENLAGDSVTPPDSSNSEPATLNGEELPVEADAVTGTEAQNTQDLNDVAETNEIVEKLVENPTKNVGASLEAEDEIVQEEPTEETEAEAEAEAEDEPSEDEEVEESSESDFGQLDRVAYEAQFQDAGSELAIMMQEEFQLTQLISSSGLQLYGTVPSVKQISRRLGELAEQTGKKPAFINISLQSNQLESFVVLPDQSQASAKNSLVASSNLNSVNSPQPKLTIRKTVEDTSRQDLVATATQFRQEISDIRKLNQTNYMSSAQKLYKVIIEPIEAELEANNIDVLVFSMDSGLRLLPIAALHDGEQFLIEKYAMGIVPSFGLTDTRYVNPEQSSILAMGASEFSEQPALPTMPIELKTIISNPRQGELFLNEQFTIPNFVAQNSRPTPFSIIHLGTHAKFDAGDMSDSYIQFYDDQLKIPQLQELSDELGWNTNASPIELLVLSACETALGDEEAELGFAGLAVQAGVKSALASLWYVSDLGTLALMGEFYDQLGTTLIKAEALRQTQLEMLRGNVKVDNRQVQLSNGQGLALPDDFPDGTLTLDHPYFWSSFTLIGNWN